MRRARAGRRGRRRTRPPSFPAPRRGRPVVIVGDGPAGIFAALRLAELGVPAVIVERGKPVQARRRDLAALNKQGVVDPESNYCFGEGGAGTYSDGKLYTRAQKRGPVAMVLQQLVAHGADPAILVDARPHIGSNRLPRVVSALRAPLTAKGFAVGVRVEHPQPLIDRAQYGADVERYELPAASYRLATTIEERGVFSFCMCPGGWIVPATTERDAVVLNGMSLARRDSPFANSGIVVALEPADVAALGHPGATGGIELQAALERAAFAAGGGAQTAPAQRVL